jgi:transcriptional regulator with XRE-family HTH domain
MHPDALRAVDKRPQFHTNDGKSGWTQEDRDEWTTVFRAALTRRGKRRRGAQAHLAKICGVTESLISRYKMGKALPSVKYAQMLAEALDDPRVLSVNIDIRTKPCAVCGKEFVDEGSGIREYCEYRGACYLAIDLERHREQYRRNRIRTYHTVEALKRRNDTYAEAVLKECMSCEHDNICRNARHIGNQDCFFLAVTPFPKEGQPPPIPVLTPDGLKDGRGVGRGPAFTVIKRRAT